MTARDCAQWRGLLAMSAIGRASVEEDRALEDHLGHCEQCRQDAEEVRFAATALEFLDRAQVDLPGSEPSSPDLSVGRTYGGNEVRREERAPAPDSALPPVGVTDLQDIRRRRRRKTVAATVAAGVAAAGIAAAGIALVIVGSGPAPPSKTVALSGAHGVRASVSLVSESWGTRATLRESGQAPGQVLTVSMKTASGRWWVAGSYRTTVRQRATEVQLSCAVPSNQITDVWVTDQAGHTVLNGYVS
jgi:predicted anti-sigma-YlaC factor YlaD